MTAPAPLITTAKFSDCFVSPSPPAPTHLIRLSEESAAMWKKHLERDDSKIVGEQNMCAHFFFFLETHQWKPLTAPVAPPPSLSHTQTCSQASCAALCTAPSAPTTPTPSMCSAICRCPSPNGAPLGRSRSGTVWISFRKRRSWTRRIHQYVPFSSSPPADSLAS